MAKSRLGEVQPLTMPRMERLAALISARLVRFIHSQLHRPIAAVHFFSDSQIALHWIHSSRPLKRFVNNRVVEIRSIVSALQSSGTHVKFYYVQPEQNPADCASRGLSTKFARNHIWWCGPSLLLLPSSEWPNADCKFNLPPDISPEVEDEFQVHNAVQVYSYQSPLRFQATNRYLKLVRSTAYVLKFIGALLLKTRHRPSSLNLSHSLLTKLINAEEFTIAETLLITEHYRESEHQLKELPLHRFNVHRSADRHFRCPHRLEHAETSTISAAPILLVPAHPLTTTVVMHHHLDNFHSGVHATIASLRRRFFIPSIRSTVVKILRDRIVCKKANCLPYRYPDMPSLPSERVTRSRPFQKVGLDYLGPLHYRDAFNTKAKVWVCLFTCMATRAVHLELVLNNSTQEFLLALRRFIARRGTPDHILSDNATTFLSANDVMNDMNRIIYRAAHTAAARRALLEKIIRVDHAGELGADRIYAGQLAVLGRRI
ncbi:ubiquinone biosynthesis protein COQ7 [Ancylostoma duodenale]|uniref:Ubiquinone biosynthesis protein COQ7 n=1 Tax=Ancylostoma duodenale TaxID=51022 RepID=A0A0C2G268_9BILA|nr:ubiquinone biosynthesis protein COQ7 [Ancylostoma duodenale]